MKLKLKPITLTNMSIRIIKGDQYGEQVLYNSVTMQAFGIVHEDEDFDLEDFLVWLGKREYSETLYYEWLKELQDERAIDQYDGGYLGDGKFADNH